MRPTRARTCPRRRSAFGYLVAAVAVSPLVPVADAVASPPACMRGDPSMYRAADAVVEAVVTTSRRWNSSPITVHLVGRYRVSAVFKGGLAAGEVVIVTDTCFDKPLPRAAMGYPRADAYCLGGINLSLTGVGTKDGRPVERPGNGPGWVLFLKADRRRGAPQQTWLEVARTGFGGGCGLTRDDLPPGQRTGFDRMLERRSP